jgi:hypothetical protein
MNENERKAVRDIVTDGGTWRAFQIQRELHSSYPGLTTASIQTYLEELNSQMEITGDEINGYIVAPED